MASIHRRPDSQYFHAAFRGPDGRLVLRSTKQGNRAKALAVATELERAAKLAKSGELVESQARKILADIMERAGGSETLRSIKAADFLREWFSSKEQHRQAQTAIRYGPVVENFITSLGSRAMLPLAAITARDVQRFIDSRLKSGCAPSTVQVDGKILRAAFNRARRVGLLTTNPAEAVELPARESVERGTFTPAEVKMMVEAAEGEWRTIVLIGYFTGARLSECTQVKWEDVDLAKGTITFATTKQGKAHMLPCHGELAEHLESIAGTATPGFITPRLAGVKPSGRRGLSESFKRIARRAGVDVEMVKGSGMNQVSRRSFHALRHSFTSALANAGVAPELRMKLTGHASAAVHRGYTHHELDTLRAAVAKVPGLGK